MLEYHDIKVSVKTWVAQNEPMLSFFVILTDIVGKS